MVVGVIRLGRHPAAGRHEARALADRLDAVVACPATMLAVTPDRRLVRALGRGIMLEMGRIGVATTAPRGRRHERTSRRPV